MAVGIITPILFVISLFWIYFYTSPIMRPYQYLNGIDWLERLFQINIDFFNWTWNTFVAIITFIADVFNYLFGWIDGTKFFVADLGTTATEWGKDFVAGVESILFYLDKWWNDFWGWILGTTEEEDEST